MNKVANELLSACRVQLSLIKELDDSPLRSVAIASLQSQITRNKRTLHQLQELSLELIQDHFEKKYQECIATHKAAGIHSHTDIGGVCAKLATDCLCEQGVVETTFTTRDTELAALLANIKAI